MYATSEGRNVKTRSMNHEGRLAALFMFHVFAFSRFAGRAQV
jgi:hypothetical protein